MIVSRVRSRPHHDRFIPVTPQARPLSFVPEGFRRDVANFARFEISDEARTPMLLPVDVDVLDVTLERQPFEQVLDFYGAYVVVVPQASRNVFHTKPSC